MELVGAVAGPLLGSMFSDSGGGGSAPQQQTQTIQQSGPPAAMLPFLFGTPGTPARAATPGTPGTAGVAGGNLSSPFAGTSGLSNIMSRFSMTGQPDGDSAGYWSNPPGGSDSAMTGSYWNPGTAGTAGTAGDPGSPGTPGTPGLFPSAMEWFNSTSPQYFPGNTVAPLNQTQEAALQALSARGVNGSPVTNAAKASLQQTLNGEFLNASPGNQYLTQTANGSMLNGNPYVDSMFTNAASRVGDQFTKNTMPQLASLYSQAGRYGSGAMNQAIDTQQDNYTDTLNRLATDIYGANYSNERNLQMSAAQSLNNQFANERNNMMNAANMAPNMAATDFTNLNAMMGAGNTLQNQQQTGINADMARFNFGQNQPLEKLQALSNILQGFGGNSSTTNSTTTGAQPQSNLMGQALGGAQMSSAIANMFSPGVGNTGTGGLVNPLPQFSPANTNMINFGNPFAAATNSSNGTFGNIFGI